MAPPILRGILVVRPELGKSLVEYIVIPDREDIDAAMTTPPQQVLADAYTVNTSGVAKFLRRFYLVEAEWFAVPGPSGVLHKARVRSVSAVIEPSVEGLHELDDSVEYHEFSEPPEIDETFIIELSRVTGAGSTLPKRVLATSVVLDVEDVGPVLVNLMEAWLWMEENPSRLRGIAVLPRYRYAVVFADKVSKEEFMEDVVKRVARSVRAFSTVYRRASIALLNEGEGEEVV